MGLLSNGETLNWYEIRPYVERLKWLGIEQFIRLYDRLKTRQNDCRKWGDEIEYLLVKFDHENKRVHLSLRATEILRRMEKDKTIMDKNCAWSPEFSEFMIEGMPGMPYGSSLPDFKKVEENMRKRRIEASKFLGPDEYIMTIPCFPRLGCPNFTLPFAKADPDGDYSKSIFFPDQAICYFYPRFKNSSRNLRQRRGSNIVINVPIFRDVNTPTPFREDLSTNYGDEKIEKSQRHVIDDHIFADSPGCGHSCCGLQATLQAENIDEARLIYDQLTVITPIMLALSAGTSIYRGYLIDLDTRWRMLSEGADDRTQEERGLKPLNEQKFRLAKSRLDTTECYLHRSSSAYNDIKMQYDEKYLERLTESGIDSALARHVAHLFVRDPLQVFREKVDKLDQENWQETSNYFDDIQTSNWNNIRFKPPPLDDPSIGWRVEFRPMEVQLTDFENAAYVCFVVLLTRAILSLKLSFLIPISKVDENMKRAQKRDAVLNEKFYFRRCIDSSKIQSNAQNGYATCENLSADIESSNDESSFTEMSINEIINGSEDFPGLVPQMQRYLDSVDVDLETRRKLQQYLTLIQGRASGEVWTLARFMREFVQHHPGYKKDSVVNEEISYDLMKTMHEIADDRVRCPKLNGIEQTDGNKAMRYWVNCG